MKAPYGIEVQSSCASCTERADRLFCNIPDDALCVFDEMKYTAVYPKGAILFMEDQEPSGVFVICSGTVKLFNCTPDGKQVAVQVAGVGDVLGLSAVVAGDRLEVSAETLEPCDVKFVKRSDVLKLLRRSREFSVRVAEVLGRTCQGVYSHARAIGLSQTVEARLAMFLLERCELGGEASDHGIRFALPLTHEQIAQMIGTSRESVSRTLSDFRRRNLVAVSGSTCEVRDPQALGAVARASHA